MIGFFLGSKIGRYALLVGGAAILVLYVLFRARESGKAAERYRQLEEAVEAARKASNVQREIDRLPDGAASERLRNEWGRK